MGTKKRNEGKLNELHAVCFAVCFVWRRGGLISDRAVLVRALTGDIVLRSWARRFTLKMLLSTQVYKWAPVNLMLGVTLR